MGSGLSAGSGAQHHSTNRPTTTPCTAARCCREGRAPLETPEEGARDAAGSRLGLRPRPPWHAACVRAVRRAGVRGVQPMGPLRLFLSHGPLEAGAVRRPPPSGCGRQVRRETPFGRPVVPPDMSAVRTCRAWLACCDPARDLKNAASPKEELTLEN